VLSPRSCGVYDKEIIQWLWRPFLAVSVKSFVGYDRDDPSAPGVGTFLVIHTFSFVCRTVVQGFVCRTMCIRRSFHWLCRSRASSATTAMIPVHRG
jgi:hypothetical protein